MTRRSMVDQWTISLGRHWLEQPVDLHNPMATAAHVGTGHMIVARLIAALERETSR